MSNILCGLKNGNKKVDRFVEDVSGNYSGRICIVCDSFRTFWTTIPVLSIVLVDQCHFMRGKRDPLKRRDFDHGATELFEPFRETLSELISMAVPDDRMHCADSHSP